MARTRGPRVQVTMQGVAHVSGEVLLHGTSALERLVGMMGEEDRRPDIHELHDGWFRVAKLDDPIVLVERLRVEGVVAQPNHVFVAHDAGCCCGPHPSLAHPLLHAIANPYQSNPYQSNPYQSNPYQSNPYQSNPYQSNPYQSNPYQSNKAPESSAAPAHGRTLPVRTLQGKGALPVIAVLDTGVAKDRPKLLQAQSTTAGQISGDVDEPDVKLVDWAGVVHPADKYLDPVAGHGTFIAGIIEQLAPGCRIHLPRVLTPFGDTDEATVATMIHQLAEGHHQDLPQRPDILSLSFGGAVLESPFLLRGAIAAARAKGIVVVASAGNEGQCAPRYPAAIDGVVAVGALGPIGPAPWTNYGDWVDACAPGTDLVSAFFASFNGDYPMKNTVDIDKFVEWARWSGSSFAAPVVVAALAREMCVGNCDAQEAVARVIHAPHLLRIPGLGTVVNM